MPRIRPKLLTYTTRHVGKFFDIEFNRQISDKSSARLKQLGCVYLGHNIFRGKLSVEKEALGIAEKAVIRSNHASKMAKKSMSRQQPCWTCALSGFGNNSLCPWERVFVPVPGWDAEEVVVGKNATYDIRSCPLYKKGRK